MSLIGLRIPSFRLALALLVASLVSPLTTKADGAKTLFTQQDAVQSFNFSTGRGYQTGTVVGVVSGTSFVDFQYAPSGPPAGDALPITFHNFVLITDIDGDQIAFDADGTGTFYLGVPGAPFTGSGGPLRGTYVVTRATGKFASWRPGTVFTYQGIATNPPAPPGALGTSFGNVTYRGAAPK